MHGTRLGCTCDTHGVRLSGCDIPFVDLIIKPSMGLNMMLVGCKWDVHRTLPADGSVGSHMMLMGCKWDVHRTLPAHGSVGSDMMLLVCNWDLHRTHPLYGFLTHDQDGIRPCRKW